MPTIKSKVNFDPEVDRQIVRELTDMTSSLSYRTEPCYSADNSHFPDHRMSFVDKHLRYLKSHPSLDPFKYVANLKLMTKIR